MLVDLYITVFFIYFSTYLYYSSQICINLLKDVFKQGIVLRDTLPKDVYFMESMYDFFKNRTCIV